MKKKIFISYSHKDREWVSQWLLPRLEGAGLEVCIDYRDFAIGRSFMTNMEEAVEWCDMILLVLTPNWVESEMAKFEAMLVQIEDPLGKGGRFLPLMLMQCDLPPRLGIFTYADFKEKSNWEVEISRLLKQLELRINVQPAGDQTGHNRSYPPLAPRKVTTYKMPTTGKYFLGREKELKELEDAWTGN